MDTFKAGNPDTPVTGIATSFGGTLDVLRRAAASGKNLVIVHEPTFYSHEDITKELTGEIYRSKRDFIDKHGLVIWRFHDHWHARRPDGIITGVIEALGWNQYPTHDNPRRYTIPATTLAKLAGDIRDRMRIRTMRVVGDPNLKVANAAYSPGYTELPVVLQAFDSPDIDVLLIGEIREWTGIELARDAQTLGLKKGLHRPRTRSLRRGRHERVRRLAEDIRARGPDRIHTFGRAVLVPEIALATSFSFQRICRNIPSHAEASPSDNRNRRIIRRVFCSPDSAVTSLMYPEVRNASTNKVGDPVDVLRLCGAHRFRVVGCRLIAADKFVETDGDSLSEVHGLVLSRA